MQFGDDFRMIAKTLLQRRTLPVRFGRFISHELLPLTQTPQKSATNLSSPPTSYDCTLFDAVNGVERKYEPIHVAANAPAGASRRAAAARAAYTALVGI